MNNEVEGCNTSGLLNLGSTCFINALIQCLNFSPSIINGLTNEIEHKKDIENIKKINNLSQESIDDEEKLKKENLSFSKIKSINFYSHFKKLIIELHKENGVINPKDFIISCKKIGDDCGLDYLFSGEQNDSQELFSFLIDKLHEAKITDYEIPLKFKSLKECGNSKENKIYFSGQESFKKYYDKKYSWLIDEFYFQIISITNCNNCDYYTLSFDPANILILPIPDMDNKTTLYDCLDHYFGKDILSNDNCWKCDKCSNTKNNSQQYRLFDTPKTLVISIKRFEYNALFGNFCKNNENIDFPNVLNMSNYKLLNKNQDSIYELYGIINHIGNLNSGHYYSFCKNINNNKWYFINDENINLINDETKLVTNNAYMLFYKLKE